MTDQMIAGAAARLDDLLAVDRSDRPRNLIGLPGQYQIRGWRDSEGRPRQFPCEIQKISPHTIKISASIVGSVGDWIEASFAHLGKFEGPVIQVAHRALVMKVVSTNEERAKVASKLAWVTDAEKPEARRYPRIVPNAPESIVSLAGGQTMPCEVIDYSAGGAAVYAEIIPPLGSVVKVGTLLGRVVRQFGGGFAVAFLTLQDPKLIESLILQPHPTPSPP